MGKSLCQLNIMKKPPRKDVWWTLTKKNQKHEKQSQTPDQKFLTNSNELQTTITRAVEFEGKIARMKRVACN